MADEQSKTVQSKSIPAERPPVGSGGKRKIDWLGYDDNQADGMAAALEKLVAERKGEQSPEPEKK